MPAFVLIVEDEANAREGLVEYFGCQGIPARGAATSDEALALAFETTPAAVVTDIQLPETSGFDLAEMLRHRLETRHVPVVGMTGHWSPEISSRAARAGMAAILMKPCLPAHLAEEVRRLVSERIALFTAQRCSSSVIASPPKAEAAISSFPSRFTSATVAK